MKELIERLGELECAAGEMSGAQMFTQMRQLLPSHGEIIKAALSQKQEAVGKVVEANDGTLTAIVSSRTGALKVGDSVYTAPPSTSQGSVGVNVDLLGAGDFINDAPKSWDSDYRSVWAKLQAAQHNKNRYRAALAKALSAPPSTAQGVEGWIDNNKFKLSAVKIAPYVVDAEKLVAFLSSQPIAQDGMVMAPDDAEEILEGLITSKSSAFLDGEKQNKEANENDRKFIREAIKGAVNLIDSMLKAASKGE